MIRYDSDTAALRRISTPRRYLTVGIVLLICLGITLSEWIFSYQNVEYGVILSLFLALTVYLIIPLVKLGQVFTECAESLVLIPLYISLTSSLPWFFLDQQFLLPAVYTAILVLCSWHIYRKGISIKELGFSHEKVIREALIGIAVGMPLGAIEYFVIRPAAAFPTFEIQYLIRDFVYMVLFVGAGEEILFRGLIQKDLSHLVGWKWGLTIASLLFGIMHLTWRSTPELGFTTFAGLFFGYLYHRTGKLTMPIFAHGAGNTILVAVMPYLFR